MLYLEQNATNIIYANLLERIDGTLDAPITWSFLINLTNDFSKESFTCLQIYDKSIYRLGSGSLMAKYPISVLSTGSANGKAQELLLKIAGYYTYDIYLQESLTNLDIKNASVGRLLESGKAFVYRETPEVEYVEANNGNPNNFIYIPN